MRWSVERKVLKPVMDQEAVIAGKYLAGRDAGADDAYRSFHSGELIPQTDPQTIADGLRTSLGDKTFEIITERVDNIILAEEDEIIRAMRFLWERMKIVVEPSGAVSLVPVLEGRLPSGKDLRVGVILSGGNVNLQAFFDTLK